MKKNGAISLHFVFTLSQSLEQKNFT